MILWIILFLLVVAISFVLAYQSMRDYQEIPLKSKEDYGLYLVRKPENLNAGLLDSIRELIKKDGLVISLERLFKGQQAALVIFGPKKILTGFSSTLDLLELEDYSLNVDSRNVSTWEMGVKNKQLQEFGFVNIFQNLPKLLTDEQFLWQIVLGVKDGTAVFDSQIRAAIYSQDPQRRKTLAQEFQIITAGELVKIPRPFSQDQMMAFYRLRSLAKDSSGPLLGVETVINLVKIV